MTPATSAVPPGYAVPTLPPPGVAPQAVPVTIVPPAPVPDEEIRVYGHSNLFYWWPVWVIGFLMAFLTYLDGHVMAIVPEGTTVESGQLVPPAGHTLPPASAKSSDPAPRLRVAANNNYGVVLVGAILLVVLVTNVTLRGLKSIIAVAVLVIAGLTLALTGWWDDVLLWLGGVDVRMNAGGYLALSIPLFLLWLFVTFVYDHYTYLVVTRGQVRIRKEIGEGEIAVDTSGLLLEKKRDDLFRHWLLGMGSGDLQVKTGTPSNLAFDLPNVLFIGWKLAKIQDMIREKEVAHQAATG